MMRPREFDEDDVLEKAMLAFWERGYEGTSTNVLVAATGLTRSSIYLAFGNKEQLFWRADERYRQRHLAFVETAFALEKPRDIAQAILMGEADMFTSSSHPPGCFEVNGALACSEASESVRAGLVANRCAIQARLRRALEEASGRGPLLRGADAEESASWVFTLIQGMAVRAKAGQSRAELHRFVSLALEAWPVS